VRVSRRGRPCARLCPPHPQPGARDRGRRLALKRVAPPADP
jgi:hypothetical protein